MRSADWKQALVIRDQWNTPEGAKADGCALFQSPDRLLQGIVRLKVYPGHTITDCPHCSHEHRWPLIKQLLIFAFDLIPRGENRVLDAFYDSLAEERQRYGGEEGYRKMRQEAEAFFAKHPTGDVYLP